jgi:hypothetical protein
VNLEPCTYNGLPGCFRLKGENLDLVLAGEFGPRIMRLGFHDGANIFREFPEDFRPGKALEEFRLYGGHRLWTAPEVVSRTYSPDNRPCTVEAIPGGARITGPVEEIARVQKTIEITVNVDDSINVLHTVRNMNAWPVEFSAWGLSAMREGGRVIIPHERFKPHTESLLPARPMVLWHYTDMTDPRWRWGKKFVQLFQSPTADSPQKAGFAVSEGWLAYVLADVVFVKRFQFAPGATYPDMGCNAEVFTDSRMLEVESLSPLTLLGPDASLTHIERWHLFHATVGESEADVEEQLTPLIEKTNQGLMI